MQRELYDHRVTRWNDESGRRQLYAEVKRHGRLVAATNGRGDEQPSDHAPTGGGARVPVGAGGSAQGDHAGEISNLKNLEPAAAGGNPLR